MLTERQAIMMQSVLHRGKLPGSRYLLSLVSMEAAVVLRGLKPAALLNIRRQEPGQDAALRYLTRVLPLCAAPLYADDSRTLLLIYDREALQRTLRSPDIRPYLRELGYPDFPAEDQIACLARHCGACGSGEFPHEIGFFLGYPPEDVRSFIENGGKNCKLCGYWKVYHNEERAKAQFDAITALRSRVAGEINRGVSCYQALRSCTA